MGSTAAGAMTAASRPALARPLPGRSRLVFIPAAERRSVAAPSTAAHTSTTARNALYWYRIPHQPGSELASIRSARSGTVASETGEASGKNSRAPNSHSIV